MPGCRIDRRLTSAFPPHPIFCAILPILARGLRCNLCAPLFADKGVGCVIMPRRLLFIFLCCVGCKPVAGAAKTFVGDTTDSQPGDDGASGDITDSQPGGDGTSGDITDSPPGGERMGDGWQEGDNTPPNPRECDKWQSAHPTWLWCDDFEDQQDMTVNYNDVSSNGMAITSEDPYSGDYSLRQHYTLGQVDAGWISRFYADALGNDYGPIQDEIYVRWYHKFETGFIGAPPKMARVRSLGPGWNKRFSVLYWLASESSTLEIVADVSAPLSTQANSSGWLAITRSDFYFSDPANIGRWICHEMQIKTNTPGDTDGAYRFWADDRLIIEQTSVDLRGSSTFNFNEVMLDAYWNGGSPRAQNRYYDNFVIATARIGCL